MSEQHRQECAQRDVAVGWALHALEPEEEAGFARHLPHCVDCTERVRSTEAVAAVLGGGVQQLDPPPRLRAAVLAAARAQQPVRAATTSARPEAPAAQVVTPLSSAPSVRAGSRVRRVLVAAAAVGLVAFGAGWAGNALVGAGPSTTTSALPELSESSVHSTPITGSDSGDVVAVVLSDGSSASVVPLDMGAAPAGEAYWLWGTGDASGTPVALGKVVVGDGAAAELQLQDAAQPSAYPGYAISVESDTGVPVAPSTVIGSSGTI